MKSLLKTFFWFCEFFSENLSDGCAFSKSYGVFQDWGVRTNSQRIAVTKQKLTEAVAGGFP